MPLHKRGSYMATPGDHLADTTPDQHMHTVGWTDAAPALDKAHRLTPTIGHRPGQVLTYRCDRAYLSPDLAPHLTCYTVIDTPQARELSDHLPVTATIDLPPA